MLVGVISRDMLNWQTMDTYPSNLLTNTVRADKGLAIQTDRQKMLIFPIPDAIS